MKTTHPYIKTLIALAAAGVFTFHACSIRRSPPLKEPLSLTEPEKAGQRVFMSHCQRCHPQGEGGLGPAIHAAPSFVKRFQIRHGAGAMPAFRDDHISDEELDQVLAYLKVLKKNS